MTITMSGSVLPRGRSACIRQAVKKKAGQPDQQVGEAEGRLAAIVTHDQHIRDLDGDHRREDRADQIQKIGDVIHRKEDGREDADERDRYADGLLLLQRREDGDRGHAGGIGVEEVVVTVENTMMSSPATPSPACP